MVHYITAECCYYIINNNIFVSTLFLFLSLFFSSSLLPFLSLSLSHTSSLHTYVNTRCECDISYDEKMCCKEKYILYLTRQKYYFFFQASDFNRKIAKCRLQRKNGLGNPLIFVTMPTSTVFISIEWMFVIRFCVLLFRLSDRFYCLRPGE